MQTEEESSVKHLVHRIVIQDAKEPSLRTKVNGRDNVFSPERINLISFRATGPNATHPPPQTPVAHAEN